MMSGKPQNAALQLCQNVKCLKSKLSERIFWKKEIDLQYQFHLATLIAEQDTKFLIKEHTTLVNQIEKAEDSNVKLRKEIKVLETELYLMYQRNVHDSAVIDGLQEAHYSANELDHLESNVTHKLQITNAEGHQENVLSNILKEEINLLKKKDVEDKELITSLKPLEEHLKEALAEEKLKNHQQGMKYKTEYEDWLQEFQKRNSDLQSIVNEKSSAILWALEAFSLILRNEMESGQQVLTESETDSVASSQVTDLFDVSSHQETTVDKDDHGEKFEKMKEEHSEFVALKELLDSKNIVNIRVVLNCLKQFSESVQNLAQEYLSVYEVAAEIAFIKEYFERLDLMRKKKDIVINEDCMETASRLDQLNLIYNSLMTEKMFLINALQHFTSTFAEDFEAHCVNLRKMEDLFISTDQIDPVNGQDGH